MHAEGADEVAFEEPEGFSQEQGAGDLDGDAVDDLAPELMRHQRVEILLREGVLGARGDGSARAGQREPETLHMALGEDHGGVKADDGEAAGDVEDDLDDVLADALFGVVELGGVVPGEGGAVVAVVHEARGAVAVVADAEGDGGVGLVVVMVLDLDLDARIGGEVRPLELVGRERTFRAREEPFRMLDHPLGVDAHVVGDHVAGESQTGPGGALAQVVARRFAAQVFSNRVVLKRVGGGDRVGIAAQALDGFRGFAALPQADQPETSHAARGEQLELFVRNLVKTMDVTAILLRELLKPDVGVLGEQHNRRHPGLIGAESLVLDQRRLVIHGIPATATNAIRTHDVIFTGVGVGVEAGELVAFEALAAATCVGVAEAAGRGRMEAHPDGDFLLMEHIDGQQDAAEVGAEDGRPLLPDEVQLAGQRVRRGKHGRAQHLKQTAEPGRDGRALGKELRQHRRGVVVSGSGPQRAVLKEDLEWLESRVAVGEPEEHELFERGLAVRQALARAGEPLLCGQFAAEDGDVRELLGELEQQTIDLLGRELRREPAQSVGEDGRVDFLAVARHQCMAKFVDEAHGEKRACVDGLRRDGTRVFRLAHFTQTLGESAAGGHVREDDIAGKAEQQVAQVEPLPDGARDVKFHASALSCAAGWPL